ncbi:MAG: cupredoxin domain-containing protein [Acidimicrobiales bacterium]
MRASEARSRRGLACVLAAVALLAAACARSDPSASQSRRVLVDYNDDEFAGSFLTYFPQVLTVRPGDTVEFKQAWTGEAHSVTMGTLVDKAVAPVRDLIRRNAPIPDEPPPEILEALAPLPEFLGEDGTVNQVAGQPCYLDQGLPPTDPETPCPKTPQPAFNGRQSYYNSGFIPYEGEQGNQFTMKLADDIAPGTYNYYCNLHGPLMSGEIVVQPKGSDIPSQSSVDKAARAEIQKVSAPLLQAYNQAKAGQAEIGGQKITGYLSGFASDAAPEAFISEFIPRQITAKVGQKVTWNFVGGHTVSFGVPSYFPQYTVADDGRVTFNPQAYQPVGGPGAPPGDSDTPPVVDGGTWDGSGFRSSGSLYEGEYSLTFTKPGRYKYACLIHPRMVGEILVE